MLTVAIINLVAFWLVVRFGAEVVRYQSNDAKHRAGYYRNNSHISLNYHAYIRLCATISAIAIGLNLLGFIYILYNFLMCADSPRL